MIFDLRHGYKEGVYSIVYFLDDRAYKLFRSRPEVPPRQTREGRREIFNRQCEGYRVAASFAYVSAHIPQYFGNMVVEDVISTRGSSIKDDFLLDCCYVIERLVGQENKVTDDVVLEQWPHVFEERRRLESYRIRTMDASVFNADDPTGFKLIDFEMEF